MLLEGFSFFLYQYFLLQGYNASGLQVITNILGTQTLEQ